MTSDLSQKRSYGTVLLVSMIGVAPPFIVGALAVQLQADFGMSRVQLGAASSVFRGTIVVSSILIGMQVDRIGFARAMRLAATFSTVSLLMMAFAPSMWWLYAALLVGGLGSATGIPSSNVMVAAVLPRASQGIGFGIQQAAPPVMAILSGLAVSAIALTVGWRYVPGSFAVVAVIAFLSVPNIAHEWIPRARDAGAGPPIVSFISLGIPLFLSFGAASALSVFIVDAAVFAGFPESRGGLLLALGGVCAAISRIVNGLLVDKLGIPASKLATFAQLGGAVGFTLFIFAESFFLLTVATVLAFGFGWGVSGLIFLLASRLDRERPASASGKVLMAGAAGGVVGPVSFGALVDYVSYRSAWIVAGGACLLGAISLIWYREGNVQGEVGRP